MSRRLSAQQQLLYASNRHAVLVIFQAMDAAGKDGVIKHVMSGVNPQGCQVFSFKHPSATELQHDFLWRTTRDLPERGRIGIFNRSYYEEVLVVRVHPEILRNEGLAGPAIRRTRQSGEAAIAPSGTWNAICTTTEPGSSSCSCTSRKRSSGSASCNESMTPEKNWKFSQADIEERAFWPHYMKAYEKCLGATSTDGAPWYIVPADDKPNARLIVSEIILETLENLKMSYPKTSEERRQELLAIREQLVT